MSTDRDVTKAYSIPHNIMKLERLIECMRSGKPFRIQVAGEEITVPADAEFSIEHEREGGAEELEFQFRWSTRD